jgi:hypothetical protein
MADKHPKKRSDAKALARWSNEGGAPASGDMSMRKRPKFSRDPKQAAKQMVDLATGEVNDREPTHDEQGKDPAAVEHGRRGPIKAGRARADTLPSARPAGNRPQGRKGTMGQRIKPYRVPQAAAAQLPERRPPWADRASRSSPKARTAADALGSFERHSGQGDHAGAKGGRAAPAGDSRSNCIVSHASEVPSRC